MASDQNKHAIAGIKNFVAVASGKGGVGKSTVSVNLAAALTRQGARVGLLDADIYGPTVPLMMGPDAKIDMGENDIITPAVAHGIKFMSMGFMAPGNKPLIWRGPMAHHALQQCIFQVNWGELDYLLIDLPPGTGDVHLTLVQLLKLTGAVIVSTPQDVGLTISLKTLQMFRTTRVPILGLVENMSYYECRHCHNRDPIFGFGTVEDTAAKLGVPFLGSLPIDTNIRIWSDKGVPIVVADPESNVASLYGEIAEKLGKEVSTAQAQAPFLKIIEESLPTV